MRKKKSNKPIDKIDLGRQLYIASRYCQSRVDRNNAILEWDTQCLDIEKDDYIATAIQFHQHLIDNAKAIN